MTKNKFDHKKYDSKLKSKNILSIHAKTKGVPTSSTDEEMIKLGSELIKNSVNNDRDFCKTMITVSTGAIPIYLGLIKFILPSILSGINVVFFIPPILFFFGTVAFILGYKPKKEEISLDTISKEKYKKIIFSRQNFINYGLSFFMVGIAVSIGLIMIYTIY